VTRARLETGRLGEQLAAERLAGQGWTIRARNWRGKGGEIDIVAEDGDCLVLVEVRARRGPRFGSAEESLDAVKQRRMAGLAEQYVLAVGWPGPWRIDAVALDLRPDGTVARWAHYRDAVQP
jgi:putative endonuclease